MERKSGTNISLAFSPSSYFSSFFFSHLETVAASSSRDSLFVACTPGLSTKSRSGSIRGLKCLSNAMLSSILPLFRARCFFLLRTRSSSQSPSRFFHAHLPCSSLVKNWQRLVSLQYRELIKSFSVLSIYERTVSLSITRNPYFCC